MKKFIFMMIAMISMAFSANAQYNVSGHKFFDNWSVGTDGGVSTNLHDWDTPNGGVWGIQLTKGVTPVVSFEFSGQLGFNDNANWNVDHSSNAVDNVTVMGSTKINLMNWFCGYNGTPRIFEIQARGGVGYMRSFYPDAVGGRHGATDVNRAVAKLGVDFDFNVGKAKAWTLSLRPAVVLKGQNDNVICDNAEFDKNTGAITNNCSRYSHNAVGQLTAGVTYHFKTSNGTHHFTNVDPVEVTRVVEKVVEKPVEKVVEKTVEKSTTQLVQDTYVVQFGFDDATLTDKAKTELNKIGQNAVVVVDAYASPEGDEQYNLGLSQRRANVVKEYLESRGVKVDSANFHGAADEFSNRIAIVTLK